MNTQKNSSTAQCVDEFDGLQLANEAAGVMWLSHDVMNRINTRLGHGTAGAAFLVYITLLTIASESGDDPAFAASLPRIIAVAKMPECDVLAALKDLERLGVLSIKRGDGPGERNTYTLLAYRRNVAAAA